MAFLQEKFTVFWEGDTPAQCPHPPLDAFHVSSTEWNSG